MNFGFYVVIPNVQTCRNLQAVQITHFYSAEIEKIQENGKYSAFQLD
ncbi:hypothetical protein C943_04236 [Mariniradius saccharolyticus AK6]|uniref:Uncharacterized protein n=1 Tax=Mariniradius saccharolyticus AK6 TaxID=1239962 RepID=M7XZK2_9BACT|nr:hypothetical protein C943_04236 [Mariniradius saccharolyticus AK6]